VFDTSEWVEAGMVVATLAYGSTNGQKSFVLYFDAIDKALKSVLVFFTFDGKLVLDLSTEYNVETGEEAERVLARLKADFNVTPRYS
jgi:hypothetical protein